MENHENIDENILLAMQGELINREIFLEVHEEWIKQQPDGELMFNDVMKKLGADKLKYGKS